MRKMKPTAMAGCSAYLGEVVIDQDGKGLEVPGLICETAEQKIEWEGGERRRFLKDGRDKLYRPL